MLWEAEQQQKTLPGATQFLCHPTPVPPNSCATHCLSTGAVTDWAKAMEKSNLRKGRAINKAVGFVPGEQWENVCFSRACLCCLFLPIKLQNHSKLQITPEFISSKISKQLLNLRLQNSHFFDGQCRESQNNTQKTKSLWSTWSLHCWQHLMNTWLNLLYTAFISFNSNLATSFIKAVFHL